MTFAVRVTHTVVAVLVFVDNTEPPRTLDYRLAYSLTVLLLTRLGLAIWTDADNNCLACTH